MEKKNVFVMLIVSIVITMGVALYCIFFGNQYAVIFDSNGGTNVEKQFVQVGDTAIEPEDPVREGYQFVEWQLNGKKYDFREKVKKKITLVAHWRKVMDASELIYKVIFDSNGGTKIDDQEVLAGESANKPTDPVKEGYTFEGWFSGDYKFDFSKKILKDTTLTAQWKKNDSKKEETDQKEEKPSKDDNQKEPEKKPSDNISKELKVGDRVKIIGEYAESSTSTKARHRRAIGWQRVVLKIYEGREYPYRVGNDTGTTGFFKAESLEKID